MHFRFLFFFSRKLGVVGYYITTVDTTIVLCLIVAVPNDSSSTRAGSTRPTEGSVTSDAESAYADAGSVYNGGSQYSQQL